MVSINFAALAISFQLESLIKEEIDGLKPAWGGYVFYTLFYAVFGGVLYRYYKALN